MLVERTRETIRRHRLIEPGERILAAVSGGADSVALLHVLAALRGEMRFDLAVGHLDHGLRPGSAEDARFVAGLAGGLGLPFRSERADLAARGDAEDLARRARYDFLERTAAALGAGKVATGHHADDQAETILLRLLRGAGAGGLAGMPLRRPLGSVEIVRPLLDATREEIRGFLAFRRLPFREDPTNAAEGFLRNRVRLRLIPFLVEHFAPRVRDRLLALAEVLRDEDAFVEAAARAAYTEVAREDPEGIEVDLAALAAAPPALRRRILRRALLAASKGGAAVEMDHVAAVLDLAGAERSGGRLDLAGGVRAERTAGRLRIGPARAEAAPGPVRFEVAVPGETVVSPLGVVLETTLFPRAGGVVPIGRRGRAAHFDADAVRPPLLVRTRLPGDRFVPLGMKGTKTLQDLLVDAKVPRGARDRVPVLADAEGVVWVVGVREGARCRLRKSTRRCLRVVVRDMPPETGGEEIA